MKYYAHYDRGSGIFHLLAEHLHNVSQNGQHAIPPTVAFPSLEHQDVKVLAKTLLFVHDIGKYTDYFQSYLTEQKTSKLSSHAHISACFARAFVKSCLEHVPDPEKQVWAFIAYLCVRFHHGNPTLKELFSNDVWWTLEQQHANLSQKWIDVLTDLGLQEDEDFLRLLQHVDLCQWRSDTRYFLHMPQHMKGRLRKDYWFFALYYFFSLLIDSDKLDSGGILPSVVKTVPAARVTDYIRAKHGGEISSPMTEQRERARQQMLSVLKGLGDEQIRKEKFFTITAPTGIGKTLASLECALYLQQRIAELEGYVPRIITAIPFINIIEQSRQDYEAVFGKDMHVLAHHRLADLCFSTEGDEGLPLDQRLLLTEAWEADVVLTTFVQLFHSIFTNRNRPLKKFHKLAGSIIILDEVQALPEKYMPLIGAVLRKIAEYYGTRFILMTATHPQLLELGDRLLGQSFCKPVELLPSYREYFASLTRTRLISQIGRKRNGEEFFNLFLDTWQPHQSALIVVNTIRRSKEIYQLLKKAHSEGILGNVEIFYLSTNIVPWQRSQVIEAVKERLDDRNGNPVILVSTQAIEAGVDLNFDIGYRDLAPLESIIQTAGRVNRSGERGELCPVYIVKLGNDAQYIYGSHHLNWTKKIFDMYEEIPEPLFPSLLFDYYQKLAEHLPMDASRDLWSEAVCGLDLDKLNEFQLIETDGVADVFVELTKEATKLADEYERIMTAKNMPIYEKKAVLRRITTAMGQYMVQIRVNRLMNSQLAEFVTRGGVKGNFFWVPPNEVDKFYDMQTGFKDESGAAYLY
ncbi:CRISPR-associated helicase/endonuclease Cas3 [Geobacillus jurassicus]|uniref:CRISPR-associated helicase/endonuclease Cas3 n=1 Tax=Geobacillus jurassicus TaxID=235932 RepID=A0ABV6GR71_9BACL|nr:CRISPR-associated helicase/endonuclease Cas3 [Geobacillus jurassicus]